MKGKEIAFVFVMIFLFVFLMIKYFPVTDSAVIGIEKINSRIDYVFGECPDNQIRVNLPDGYLCRNDIEESLYREMYDTYPKSANGKEVVYDFLNKGDVDVADDFLNDLYYVDRYEPLKIDGEITWEEDPYDERYWRFVFYSLRSTNNLVYAGEETGNQEYNEKLIEIVNSFIDDGMSKPYAWDDYHGVAFRTMVLTNVWWKLREQDALTVEESNKILQALEVHGNFLLEEEHYEPGYNHGITQAAALMILGANFPDLGNSEEWFETGRLRLGEGIEVIIDEDGTLIENSPYYHFYSLEKYWQIYKYSKKYDIHISDNFDNKVEHMIAYSPYILQPNLEVPLMGASIKRKVILSGEIKEMADTNKELLYVLTQGEQGKTPELNKYFQYAGQTIMRSGWGEGKDFEKQTQLIFDVGQYRTAHSDFDALSISLYSNGANLLTDSGLYTYDSGEYKSYFQGTSAHNTVIVDGKDQGKTGTILVGELVQENGYVYQTAQHNLYPGVLHKRSVVMIKDNVIVIIDDMISEEEHDYQQKFHLSPELGLETNGLTAIGRNDGQLIKISQLNSQGLTLSSVVDQNSPIDGICSYEYGKHIPCYSLSYNTNAKNVRYVTLIEIRNEGVYGELINNNLKINTVNEEYNIELMKISDYEIKRDVKEVVEEYNLELYNDEGTWKLKEENDREIPYEVKLINGNINFEGNKTYNMEIEGVGEYFSNGLTNTGIPYENMSFNIYEQEDFIPIFGYHKVLPDGQKITHPTTEISLSYFEKQIEYMDNEMNCNWMTMSEVAEYIDNKEKLPKNACAINFDDSTPYEYDVALPVLERYGIKGTFYVITGQIDQKTYRLTWKQLDEMYARGHDLQSHTYNITTGLLTEGLSYDEIIFQLRESDKQLTGRYGENIKTFAYPLGEWNDNVIRALQETDYTLGRDNSKDNTWADKRALTVFEPNANINSDDKNPKSNNVNIWHLNYYKPELKTIGEIQKEMGYNTWWQFEDNYAVIRDSNKDVNVLSGGEKPTETSYGFLRIRDGDKINTNFLISKNNKYTMEIFASTTTQYPKPEYMIIFIDGKSQKVSINPECVVSDKRYFCNYLVDVYLAKGEHEITIEADHEEIYLDKFRVFRHLEPKSSYNVVIEETEYVGFEESQIVEPAIKDISKEKSGWFWN